MSSSIEAVSRIPDEDRIPGNKGIWTGILIEVTEFALLFCVYFNVLPLLAQFVYLAGDILAKLTTV